MLPAAGDRRTAASPGTRPSVATLARLAADRV